MFICKTYIVEHSPGLVPLQVSCDGQLVSNTVIFEYKEKQRAAISVSSNTEQVKDWFSVSGKLKRQSNKLAVLQIKRVTGII